MESLAIEIHQTLAAEPHMLTATVSGGGMMPDWEIISDPVSLDFPVHQQDKSTVLISEPDSPNWICISQAGVVPPRSFDTIEMMPTLAVSKKDAGYIGGGPNDSVTVLRDF